MEDTTSAGKDPVCRWCGVIHMTTGKCPSVKAFEYHPDGTVKRVEFFSHADYLSGGRPNPRVERSPDDTYTAWPDWTKPQSPSVL